MTALNSLFELIPADGWRRLTLDFAWQTTLIGLAAIALTALYRRRPAARAAIAVTAATLFLVAPLSTGLTRHYGWGLFGEPVVEDQVTPIDFAQLAISPPTKVISTPLAVAPQPISRVELAWRTVAIGWLVVSVGLFVRLLRSALAVRRLYLAAARCEDRALLTELEGASRAVGVAAPELCTSAAIDSPAVVTWGPTRLLIPENHAAIDQWRAVFCHELAHIARRDGASRLGFELLVAALPWQPLAWWLRARVPRLVRASL